MDTLHFHKIILNMYNNLFHEILNQLHDLPVWHILHINPLHSHGQPDIQQVLAGDVPLSNHPVLVGWTDRDNNGFLSAMCISNPQTLSLSPPPSHSPPPSPG